MKQSKIECNSCRNILSEPTHYPGYYIHLRSISRPKKDLAYTIFVAPEIERHLDFCDLECLQEYFQE